MSLFDALSQISEQVKQHRELMHKSEATVEQVSVLPFIDALGYDTQSPAEVRQQYAILNWDAVDFAILRNNEPIMVIEAKKASENLTKHWKQLFQYFNADKASVGILTNGIEYRFYIDSVKQNIMDNEPSLTVSLDSLDKVAVARLEGFTKMRFHRDHSLRKIKISNLLSREFQRPSDEFVRYFAKQIHSGAVWQTVIEEFRPIVKQCWDELVDQEIARRLRRHEETEEGQAEILKEPDKPDPQPTDIPVFGSYEGHRFEATLMIDDRMWLQRADNMLFDGRPMNHADAAFEAVKKVDPLTKKSPAGWIFWRFIDSDTGEERPIKEIFEEVWTRNSSNGY